MQQIYSILNIRKVDRLQIIYRHFAYLCAPKAKNALF